MAQALITPVIPVVTPTNRDKNFIIQLAIDKYNAQHGTNLTIADMDARSIDVASVYDYGYEVVTISSIDAIRLRLMMTLSDAGTGLTTYSLLATDNDALVSTTDVGYASIGNLDIELVKNKTLDLTPLVFESI